MSITHSAIAGVAILMAWISVCAPLLPDRVHQPGGLQHQQPGLLDPHPGLGDPVLDHALVGQRPAERRPGWSPAGTSARGPARPRRSAACSGGSGPGRAGPGRSRSRRPRRRSGWPPAPGRRGTPPRRARRAARRRSRTPCIPRSTVTPGVSRGTRIIDCWRCRSPSGAVLPITMRISQPRVHRPRRPPLAAVDHVLVAVPLDPGRDVGGVRGGDVGLGHAERRPDLAVEQRPEPASCCCSGAELGQQFHVAGVRRGAVQRLRARAPGCAR